MWQGLTNAWAFTTSGISCCFCASFSPYFLALLNESLVQCLYGHCDCVLCRIRMETRFTCVGMVQCEYTSALFMRTLTTTP